jgi:hypothetical protein
MGNEEMDRKSKIEHLTHWFQIIHTFHCVYPIESFNVCNLDTNIRN